MSRKRPLLQILNRLDILYKDLNRLITEYDVTTKWEKKPAATWRQRGNPTGILLYQKNIYVCTTFPHLLFVVTPNNEKLKENLSFKEPWGMDIDEDQNILYVVDNTNVTLLNMKLDIISTWKLHRTSAGFSMRYIKINNNILYLTIQDVHQIFLCQSQDGKILNQWGSVDGSEKKGDFNYPLGITVDSKYVYVCDSWNHRVQILDKDTGKYVLQWGKPSDVGQFNYPRCIYYHKPEEFFYVGDWTSVQIYTKNPNIFIQHLGSSTFGTLSYQFHDVYGICVSEDRLYVNDSDNKRIQIFERTQETE